MYLGQGDIPDYGFHSLYLCFENDEKLFNGPMHTWCFGLDIGDAFVAIVLCDQIYLYLRSLLCYLEPINTTGAEHLRFWLQFGSVNWQERPVRALNGIKVSKCTICNGDVHKN